MKIGQATIHNIDCMEFMKSCQDNQFDLAIVDVGYGLSIRSAGYAHSQYRNVKQCNGSKKLVKSPEYHLFDDTPPPSEYFDLLFKVSKNQVIWGANHIIEKINRNSSGWIIWDKDNGGSSFADVELAWSSFKCAAKLFKYRWSGFMQGKLAGDSTKKEKRIHPTQKPVALYEWLLLNYGKPGQLIIDTHMGSGSIAIATNKHGFNLTACELDQIYFQDACKRITKSYVQPDMFTPVVPVPDQEVLEF